jgi:hypothetical protein
MTTTRRPGRVVAIGLGVYASAVLAVMWLGFGVALLWQPDLPDQAWLALRSLPAVPQVVAWLLFLPAAVGLWAWTSDLPGLVVVAIGAGLIVWSLAAFGSLARTLRTG